jgi:uncharacterized phage protein (TIGR01671 family)
MFYNDVPIQVGMKSGLVMLFTGKQDVEGKDIYEGDLIESFMFCSEKGVFETGMGVVLMRHKETKHKVHFYNIKQDIDLASHMRVIGNVYEFDSLLEQRGKNEI